MDLYLVGVGCQGLFVDYRNKNGHGQTVTIFQNCGSVESSPSATRDTGDDSSEDEAAEIETYNNQTDADSIIQIERQFRCFICSLTHDSLLDLYSHFEIHFDIQKNYFKCKECIFSCSSPHHFVEHARSVHRCQTFEPSKNANAISAPIPVLPKISRVVKRVPSKKLPSVTPVFPKHSNAVKKVPSQQLPSVASVFPKTSNAVKMVPSQQLPIVASVFPKTSNAVKIVPSQQLPIVASVFPKTSNAVKMVPSQQLPIVASVFPKTSNAVKRVPSQQPLSVAGKEIPYGRHVNPVILLTRLSPKNIFLASIDANLANNKLRKEFFKYCRREAEENVFVFHACKTCSLIFPSLYTLKEHKSEAHSHIIYIRMQSGKGKGTKKRMRKGTKRRMRKRTKNESKLKKKIVLNPLKTTKKHFECTKCGDSFKSLSKFRIHVRAHKWECCLECSKCDLKFLNKKRLKIHFKVHVNKEMLSCPACSLVLKSKLDLDNHIRTHAAERDSFECSICNDIYVTKMRLIMHAKVYEQSFRCCTCHRKFLSQCDLVVHSEMHPQDQFECRLCKLVEKTEDRFIWHLMFDCDGAFRCSKCKHMAKDKEELDLHERKHKNEDPFICYRCNLNFESVRDFHSHSRLHKKGQFPCSFCELVLETRYDYFKHMQNKCMNKQNYKCPTCCCTTNSIEDFFKHKKTHNDAQVITLS